MSPTYRVTMQRNDIILLPCLHLVNWLLSLCKDAVDDIMY